MYVVLYSKTIKFVSGYRYAVVNQKDRTLSYDYESAAQFEVFQWEKDAAEFATKNGGVVLIPAEVNLSIKKPEKK